MRGPKSIVMKGQLGSEGHGRDWGEKKARKRIVCGKGTDPVDFRTWIRPCARKALD